MNGKWKEGKGREGKGMEGKGISIIISILNVDIWFWGGRR